jgi:purine-binding chemotaxis protein CheW
MTTPITETEKAAGQVQRFLQFSLGNEVYAIPLLSVKEVIAFPEITPIPYAPSHFLGIMNLRGKIISIIDLRTKFGIKAEVNPETAVIICDLFPLTLGVVVNSVNSVLTLNPDEICPKPDIENRKSDYMTGVARKDTKLTLLIDIAKALDVKDYQILEKSAEAKKSA